MALIKSLISNLFILLQPKDLFCTNDNILIIKRKSISLRFSPHDKKYHSIYEARHKRRMSPKILKFFLSLFHAHITIIITSTRDVRQNLHVLWSEMLSSRDLAFDIDRRTTSEDWISSSRTILLGKRLAPSWSACKSYTRESSSRLSLNALFICQLSSRVGRCLVCARTHMRY